VVNLFAMNITDTFKHQGLRRQLITELKSKGINDAAIIAAMTKIPRHAFMDNAFMESAYIDKAFPIGSGQTISQPFQSVRVKLFHNPIQLLFRLCYWAFKKVIKCWKSEQAPAIRRQYSAS